MHIMVPSIVDDLVFYLRSSQIKDYEIWVMVRVMVFNAIFNNIFTRTYITQPCIVFQQYFSYIVKYVCVASSPGMQNTFHKKTTGMLGESVFEFNIMSTRRQSCIALTLSNTPHRVSLIQAVIIAVDMKKLTHCLV
jgi:hypothetical protein